VKGDKSKADLLTAIVATMTKLSTLITSQWMEQYKNLTCVYAKKRPEGLQKESMLLETLSSAKRCVRLEEVLVIGHY